MNATIEIYLKTNVTLIASSRETMVSMVVERNRISKLIREQKLDLWLFYAKRDDYLQASFVRNNVFIHCESRE